MAARSVSAEMVIVAGQHDDGSPSWLVLAPDGHCVANLTRRSDAEHIAARLVAEETPE